MRRIFGAKKNRVTDDWRKLHSEQLNDIYPTFIFRVLKKINYWKCHVARMEQSINAYSFLFGSRKEERTLGRSTLSRVDNIEIDFQEAEWGQALD